MSRWFRLYDDAINDPNILKLPEASRWQWVAVLCIASKHDGVLPQLADVALMLRMRGLNHEVLDPWEFDGAAIARVLAMPYGEDRRRAWADLNPLIGEANQRLIDEADVIFAVLDGVDVDSGTAAEIGYGFAKAKKILGYRGDFRLAGDNEGASVNLQVEYFIRKSGGAIITSIDDLPGALAKLGMGK